MVRIRNNIPEGEWPKTWRLKGNSINDSSSKHKLNVYKA